MLSVTTLATVHCVTSGNTANSKSVISLALALAITKIYTIIVSTGNSIDTGINNCDSNTRRTTNNSNNKEIAIAMDMEMAMALAIEKEMAIEMKMAMAIVVA